MKVYQSDAGLALSQVYTGIKYGILNIALADAMSQKIYAESLSTMRYHRPLLLNFNNENKASILHLRM